MIEKVIVATGKDFIAATALEPNDVDGPIFVYENDILIGSVVSYHSNWILDTIKDRTISNSMNDILEAHSEYKFVYVTA